MSATPTEKDAPHHPARTLLILVAGLGTLACQGTEAPDPGTPNKPAATSASLLNEAPTDELYAAEDRQVLLDSARQIIDADAVATLITIDRADRARARTVDCGGPDAEWSFWIATRPGTRKVAQIEAHAEVTLHFETDDEGSYVSVMGRAIIHRDEDALFDRKNPIDPDLMPELFPNYPADYLLIEVRPVWLELLSPTIEASTETWRPQAVVFTADPMRPSP